MALKYSPQTWVDKETRIDAAKMQHIEQGIQKVTEAVNSLPSGGSDSSAALTPEQYGAVGDGAVDDTEALKEAIAEASEKKQPLELTSTAVYRFTEMLELKDDLIILGNGAVLLSDLQCGTSASDRAAIFGGGSSNTDQLQHIRLEGITFRAADTCETNYMLRFMRARDVQLRNCIFDCGINDMSRSCLDVYGACNDFVFEGTVFRQLSCHKEGGIWVRSWTNAVESSNIRFLNCDFYKAGGDEVLAVWGWKGVVRDVLISGCNFYEVDEEQYTSRGYAPKWFITLGQTGTTYARMEHCVVRASRCECIFRMLFDGTHAVVDNCDIYYEQAADIPEHDMSKSACQLLAQGNADPQKTIISNCRCYFRADNGRRITYSFGKLLNNIFDVEMGGGAASTVEVIGNTFKGKFARQLFNDCRNIKSNVIEATVPSLGLFSGGSTVEGNQIALTCTSEEAYTIKKYNFPGKGTEYIEDNIVTVEGNVVYDSPYLKSVLTGTVYRKNNYFNGVREALFECTGVSFAEEARTEQYKKFTQLDAVISPANCTDPVLYTWSNAGGAVLDMGDGKYRPVKNGKATATVSCGMFSASQEITVDLVPVSCEGLKLSRTTALCAVDSTTYLKAFASPYWTTDDIVWKSDAEDIATVTQDGEVSALKTGSANITVTCGKFTVACALRVVEASELPTYTEGEWTLDNIVAYIPLPDLAEEHTLYAAFDIDTSCVDANEELPIISSLLSGQSGAEAVRLAFGADGSGYKTIRWYTTSVTTDEAGDTTLYQVRAVNNGFKAGEAASTGFLYLPEGVANPGGTIIWNAETSTVKAAPDSGVLSFNVQTSAGDSPITDYTSGAALAAALASGDIHATKATGLKLREFILFTNASYSTVDEIKQYRENAEIDLRFDADGEVVNAGTAGDFIIAGSSGEVVPVNSISLDKSALAMTVGDSDTLTASVLPADTTDKTVKWSVDPAGFATLSATKGSSITVSAAAAGKCTITATAGGKSAECVVTVEAGSSGDSDPVPVFTLPETNFVPSEQKIVDTGIKLFESEDGAKDYTIIISQRPNSADTSASQCLLHCMEETSPYPGISIAHSSAYQVNAFDKHFNDLLTRAIGYDAVNNYSFAIRVSNKRVWVKAYNQNNKSYIDSKGWVDISSYSAVDKNLLIGGYQASDGTKGRFWDGKVYWCKIYDRLLTEEQIDAIMTE